jgi:hypothetical protein
MKRTDSLQPASFDECKRVLARHPNLTLFGFEASPPFTEHPFGAPASQYAPITSICGCMQIGGVRRFFRENCLPVKKKQHWYPVHKLGREVRRWVREKYFYVRDDAGTLRDSIFDGTVIAAADLEGYAIERKSESLEVCIALSFTPKYRRLRNQWLRAKAGLYSHIFGD